MGSRSPTHALPRLGRATRTEAQAASVGRVVHGVRLVLRHDRRVAAERPVVGPLLESAVRHEEVLRGIGPSGEHRARVPARARQCAVVRRERLRSARDAHERNDEQTRPDPRGNANHGETPSSLICGRRFRHSLPDRLGDQMTPVVRRIVPLGFRRVEVLSTKARLGLENAPGNFSVARTRDTGQPDCAGGGELRVARSRERGVGAPRVARDADRRPPGAAAPGVAPVDRERGRRALGRRPRPVAPLPVDRRVRVERHLRRPGRGGDRDQPGARRARDRARRRLTRCSLHRRRPGAARVRPRHAGRQCAARGRRLRAPARARRARPLRRGDGDDRPPARRDRSTARRGVGRRRDRRHDRGRQHPPRTRSCVVARAPTAADLAPTRVRGPRSRARSTSSHATARSTSGCCRCGVRRGPRYARRRTRCSRARPSRRPGDPRGGRCAASRGATSPRDSAPVSGGASSCGRTCARPCAPLRRGAGSPRR